MDNRTRDTTFEALYAQARGSVWSWLRAVCPFPAVRDDVYQETWLRVLRASREEVIERPAAYALTVARRLLADARSRRRPEALEANLLEAPDADPRREELDAAVRALPPDRREVFVLRHVTGLSYREIAEVCGISPGTVASRMHHAVSELRRRLRPKIQETP